MFRLISRELDHWREMRIVVTGGAGFLGSHLCDALVARGDSVICVDDLSTGNLDNLAGLVGHRRFRFVEADVSAALDVRGPVDAVLHFASPASPADYLRASRSRPQGRQPRHAQRAGPGARAKGARFFLASTSEVYGDPHVHPQPEAYWGNVNPIGPRGVYDEAKRFAEAMTMAYHRHHGVDVRHRAHLQHLRPADAARRRAGGVELHRPGAAAASRSRSTATARQTRSFCYVDDLVRGILALLDSAEHGPGEHRQPGASSRCRSSPSWSLEVTGSPSEIVYEPAADRRPDPAQAGHHRGDRAAGVGARREHAHRPAADHRLVPHPGHPGRDQCARRRPARRGARGAAQESGVRFHGSTEASRSEPIRGLSRGPATAQPPAPFEELS